MQAGDNVSTLMQVHGPGSVASSKVEVYDLLAYVEGDAFRIPLQRKKEVPMESEKDMFDSAIDMLVSDMEPCVQVMRRTILNEMNTRKILLPQNDAERIAIALDPQYKDMHFLPPHEQDQCKQALRDRVEEVRSILQ